MRRILDTPEVATINVTPVIDVALVLVIILMLTAPMIATPDVELTLPQADSRGLSDQPHVAVTITRAGQIAIDATVVSREAFFRELAARMAERDESERLIVVRADEGVRHVAVRQIMAEARRAGAARIAIATRPRAGGTS